MTMKKRGFPLFGLLVAIFGGLCINYNIGEGIAEHAAWAADMGLPAPAAANYILGLGLLAMGSGLVGHRFGRPKRS